VDHHRYWFGFMLTGWFQSPTPEKVFWILLNRKYRPKI
jgi:hypothetical protein